MRAPFSRAVLRALLVDARVTIAGVVLPSHRGELPGARVTLADSIDRDVESAGIPVITHRDDDSLVGELRSLAPDFFAVACYPRRIGTALAATARVACVNVHPSLLPTYRGPDPLFWQLRDGESRTGVTIHLVDERLDAGAVLARRAVALPHGASRERLETLLAEAGAAALGAVVQDFTRVVPQTQDESLATCQPLPETRHFRIESSWTASRAYDFMRGAAGATSVFEIVDEDEIVRVRGADSLRAGSQKSFAVRTAGRVHVRFAGGVVRARPA